MKGRAFALTTMVTEAERLLISAAVDGELSTAEESAFRELVAHSPEVRQLYGRLLADQIALRTLPAVRTPFDFAARFRRTEPKRATPRIPARFIPVGLAASLFCFIASASFWFFQPARPPQRPDAAQVGTPQTSFDVAQLPTTAVAVPQPRAVPAVPAVPVERVAVAKPVTLPAPMPREVPSADLLAAPTPETKPFATVDVRLPLLVPLAELSAQDLKARFAADATLAFRLDLFANDTNKAGELLVAAARTAGLTITLEAVAQERMKKLPGLAWAIFAESLTAEEAIALCGAFAKVAEANPSHFGFAHVVPASAADAKEWRELLGTEPAWVKRAAVAPKSIAAGTVDQVASSLGKTSEKQALLVSYLPVNGRVPPSLSKEVRQFAERKHDRRPNALPLMIVIRPVNS